MKTEFIKELEMLENDVKIERNNNLSWETSTGRSIEYYDVDFTPSINKYYTKNKCTKRSGYKGFVPWLVELFDKLNIPHKAFNNSLIIEIKGKTYTLFQHQKNEASKLWFYFSDFFKARNFKNFFRKVKSFIMKEVGKKVKEVFDFFEEKMFNEMGELVKFQKSRGKTARFSTERGEIFINLYDIISFIFTPYKNSKIQFRVNKEIYRKHKDLITNFVISMMKKLIVFLSLGMSSKSSFTIRESVSYEHIVLPDNLGI